jgi:hypothetical protein
LKTNTSASAPPNTIKATTATERVFAEAANQNVMPVETCQRIVAAKPIEDRPFRQTGECIGAVGRQERTWIGVSRVPDRGLDVPVGPAQPPLASMLIEGSAETQLVRSILVADFGARSVVALPPHIGITGEGPVLLDGQITAVGEGDDVAIGLDEAAVSRIDLAWSQRKRWSGRHGCVPVYVNASLTVEQNGVPPKDLMR